MVLVWKVTELLGSRGKLAEGGQQEGLEDRAQILVPASFLASSASD